MSREEWAAGERGIGAYRGLIAQAGMTVDEFIELARHGGLNAAVRRATERAEQRRTDPRRRSAELASRREPPA